MIKNVNEQTLALAGIYQSCLVVSDIAWSGKYVEDDLLPLINSILKIDSSNIEDIYIDKKSLKTGLIYLRKQIVGDIFTRSSETRRYISSMQILADKVISNNEMVSTIQILLKELKDEISSSSVDDQSKKLSSIYQQTLSMVDPRIVVNGENVNLMNPIQAARIRTALFAGVRSIILWKQLGGSKLKLLIFKSAFSKKIDNYLKAMPD